MDGSTYSNGVSVTRSKLDSIRNFPAASAPQALNGHSLANINSNGSYQGPDIQPLQPPHPPASYQFPTTAEAVTKLILEYQDLVTKSNAERKRYEFYQIQNKSAPNKAQPNGDSSLMNADGTDAANSTTSNTDTTDDSKIRSPFPEFKDPYHDQKLAIERILSQVDSKYQKFITDETNFYNEVRSSLDSAATSPDQQLDTELFAKQIAGLQLLSKDLDLPETLQGAYEQQSLSPPPTLASKQIADSILNDIFMSLQETKQGGEQEEEFKKDDDFVKQAESIGIKTPSSFGTSNPLYSSVGNYYTEQAISNKITQRIQELENLPATIGTFHFGSLDNQSEQNLDDLKIKVLIELKSLQTLSKQKQLKNHICRKIGMTAHYDEPNLNKNPLVLQARRSLYLRDKIDQPNPQALALHLEDRQKLELRRKEHQKHVSKISKILASSKNYTDHKLARISKKAHFIKTVGNFHSNTEKEESRKLERTAKQRLQALKANDEEAYIKLLDQTKDHRITHLLKQTNSFLDTLAQAVKVQQAESGNDIASVATPDKDATATNKEDGEHKEDTADELREKLDYYQVVHRIQEEVTEQSSLLVGGKLKDYQIKGLQWMVSLYNNKLNGILADEMGLGKTIQSISLVSYLIEKKHEDKFLVIVPLSTITNWTIEFEKWAPTIKVIVYKGSQEQRRNLQFEVRGGNFQVILTTYEYIIRERNVLAKFQYSHMIIDEGHRLKNANSKLAITLKTFYRTKNRLILTGTPLQNNLPELWALLNFVLPKVFNSVKSFDEWFNTPFANTGSQEKLELTEEESLLVIRRLHKVLRPFLLRRLKKDVEKDLPDKVEKVLKCNLSGLQYILYQQMLKHNAFFVGADAGGAKSGIKGLNNKIMQLRKICNHPFVFEEIEDVLDSSRLTNDLIWRTSGKFELLDRVLPKFKASGHRVLLFFQMTQVMNIMEDFLRYRDMKYLRLDGSTKADERQDMLKVFNAPDSEYFCFLLSTRAGGLGLNLQTADTVIIFDTDWNPHQDLQAQDRAHRIGQKNEVRILRLISNDSVEEVILERAHQKLDIDGKVIQAGKFDNKSTAEEQEAFLKRLLEAEANRDDSEENGQLDEDDLNEVLARSDEERIMFSQMDADRKEAEKLAYEKHKGYKSRLMGKDELPPVFTEDISHHFDVKVEELGRMREKKKVKYDDGLTEEQWLNAMDDDEDTVEAAIKRKEARSAKRRRTLALKDGVPEDEIDASDLGAAADDDDEQDEEENNRKAKKMRLSASADGGAADEQNNGEPEGDADEFITKANKVIDGMMELDSSDGSGRKASDVFIRLPSRKLYADYYKIIKHVVSITQVKKQVSQYKFGTIEEVINEFRVMVANAKIYNEEGSWVYEDANVIEEYLNSLDV